MVEIIMYYKNNSRIRLGQVRTACDKMFTQVKMITILIAIFTSRKLGVNCYSLYMAKFVHKIISQYTYTYITRRSGRKLVCAKIVSFCRQLPAISLYRYTLASILTAFNGQTDLINQKTPQLEFIVLSAVVIETLLPVNYILCMRIR